MYDRKHDIRDAIYFRNHVMDHLSITLGTCRVMVNTSDCDECVLRGNDICYHRPQLMGKLR